MSNLRLQGEPLLLEGELYDPIVSLYDSRASSKIPWCASATTPSLRDSRMNALNDSRVNLFNTVENMHVRLPGKP